jgi:hypothetical protein
MPYGIAALHGLVGKNKGRFISKAIGEKLCQFREEKQPELASGGLCRLEFYSSSRIEQSYDRLKLSREAESVPEYDQVRSLCIIKRPARIATDSGLNRDIPAAHLH